MWLGISTAAEKGGLEPVELDLPTRKVLPWGQVHSIDQLLAMRARQIQRRDEDIDEAGLYLQQSREHGKNHFDSRERLRIKDLDGCSSIILHYANLKYKYSYRLNYRCLRSYKITR